MPYRLKILPWVVGMAFFMQWFDTGALNTILPVVASDFGQNPMRMQSLVLGFMLTMILLMPVSGWLADKYGIRTVFMLAVTVFMAGSVLCAFSWKHGILLTGKIIQGAGGAFLLPLSRLAIIKSYSREKLTGLLSFIAVPGLVGLFVGPIIGGVLATYLSWRWVFYLNVPIGLAILFCARRYYPVLKADVVHRFDWPGFFLIGMVVFCAASGVEGYVDWHWPASRAWVFVGMAIAGIALYFLYARKVAFPLFGLNVFRVPSFTIGLIGNLLNGLTGGAVPFMVPLLLQVVFGLQASLTGFVMASGAMASILAKNIVPCLLEKIGYRWFLCINTVLLGIAILAFVMIDPATPLGLMMLFMGTFSGINSFQFTSTFTMSLIDLEPEDASNGNTVVSVISQFFAGISVGLTTILLSLFSSNGLESVSASVFRSTFVCIAMLNVGAVVLFLFVPHELKSTGKCSGQGQPAGTTE